MALYISKVVLPGGSTQYLIKDSEARAMIAPEFNTETAYANGDHVIYNGELYRFHQAHSAGAWNANHVDLVTVDSEIQRLETLIGDSGLRYIGLTYTNLYDGATTEDVPFISIVGGEAQHIAKTGDIVFYPLTDNNTSIKDYEANHGYREYDVIQHNEGTAQNPVYRYYRANQNIAAQLNTDFEAIEWFVDYIGVDNVNLEFLYNGNIWNLMGGASEFGSLAYKDMVTAQLTDYMTGGSVSVSGVVGNVVKTGLSTTQVREVGGTTSVSKMTAGTAIDVAKAGTAVRYGTADVGTAVTYGTADRAASATTVGNANVGEAVVYGKANVGAAVTVATAGTQVVYGTANVGAAVTYGTANPGTAVTGVAKVGANHPELAKAWTENYTTGAVSCKVEGEVLQFTPPGYDSVIGIADATGVSITPAVASNTQLTPAVAAPTTQKLTPVGGTRDITPAVSAPNTQTLTPAVASETEIFGAVNSSKTLTPAVAAPNNQTIVPAIANGNITPWTESAKTVATAAIGTTLVVNGLQGTATEVVTDVTTGTVTANITPTTTTKTIISR